jgi:hypothetical protein
MHKKLLNSVPWKDYIGNMDFKKFISKTYNKHFFEEIKNNYKNFRKWVKDGKSKFYEYEKYDIDVPQFEEKN